MKISILWVSEEVMGAIHDCTPSDKLFEPVDSNTRAYIIDKMGDSQGEWQDQVYAELSEYLTREAFDRCSHIHIYVA